MNKTLRLYVYAACPHTYPEPHPDSTSNSLLDHPSKYSNPSITNLPSGITAGNKNAQKEWPQVSHGVYETVILASVDYIVASEAG